MVGQVEWIVHFSLCGRDGRMLFPLCGCSICELGLQSGQGRSEGNFAAQLGPL